MDMSHAAIDSIIKERYTRHDKFLLSRTISYATMNGLTDMSSMSPGLKTTIVHPRSDRHHPT